MSGSLEDRKFLQFSEIMGLMSPRLLGALHQPQIYLVLTNPSKFSQVTSVLPQCFTGLQRSIGEENYYCITWNSCFNSLFNSTKVAFQFEHSSTVLIPMIKCTHWEY